jgi:Ni,Fe-hydrogenase I large subunit
VVAPPKKSAEDYIMKFSEYLKSIDGDVTIEKITAIFGDKDIVLNGIPKEKFNDKIAEINTLKSQLSDVNTKLDEFSKKPDMTEEINKLKGQLAAKEQEFIVSQRTGIATEKLKALGCAYPELIVNQLGDLSTVDIDKIDLKPVMEKFPNMFPKEQTANTSAASTTTGVNAPAATRDILIQQYNEAEKKKDYITQLSIANQLRELK